MRAIIRVFLVLLLLVVVGALTLDYWTRGSVRAVRTEHPSEGVATSGSIDAAKARARGAEVGKKAAIAAQRMKDTVGETVRSASEHARAVALARETAGVTQVVDRLQIRQ